MRKFQFILLAFCVVLLPSCEEILDPSLERIEQVTIKDISKDLLEFNAVMIIHNPNSFALELSSADLVAIVDEVELATIKQEMDAEMPAQGDFAMPINIKLDLVELYRNEPLLALSKGLQMMAQKKVDVLFKGTIKAGKGAAKISVPIDQMEEVKW